MPKGTLYASEAVRLRDERTGVAIWQMTAHPSIQHHLYFLTSSMTPDGKRLIFTSYRTGSPNFFAVGFPRGDIVQLTDGEGIHGFSGVLDPTGETLYFTRKGEVRSLDLVTLEERVLADYGEGQLGECDLNTDGSLLVTAMKRGGLSQIVVTKTDGSGGAVIAESPRTIIHPQFHPTDTTLIEYASDPAPRMWTIRADGSENTLLWNHDNSEFLVHETFLGKGDDLVVVRWPYALQRFSLASRQMTTIAAFNAWHIAPSRDGRYVLCDTAHPDIGIQLVCVETGARKTLCYPDSSNRGTQWRQDRYALAEDFARASLAEERAKNLSWMEMKSDSVYGPQWTHPHPSFGADERTVVFTSDRTGHPQVYVAEIPEGFFDF